MNETLHTPSRHVKIIRFSIEEIWNLFFLLSRDTYCVPVLENIPKDVVLRKVVYDPYSDTLNFFLEHPTFPEVIKGQELEIELGTYQMVENPKRLLTTLLKHFDVRLGHLVWTYVPGPTLCDLENREFERELLSYLNEEKRAEYDTYYKNTEDEDSIPF